MQKLVTHWKIEEFDKLVNEYMSQGWTIVEGTLSIELARTRITNNYFAVVLYKPE
jgi:hypothetical protein